MLFIYTALALGGVETFFVRMAKERKKMGLYTAILLISNKKYNNIELLKEVNKYADVFYYADFFSDKLSLFKLTPLLSKINKKHTHILLNKVHQIHVSDGMHALLANKINNKLKLKLPITVGIYHYSKYSWGNNNTLPYYERVNREFVFDYLPQNSILYFSKGNRDYYSKVRNEPLKNGNVFRLGVVDKKEIDTKIHRNKTLRVVAVGRLVDFKTYNLFMINVIKELKQDDYNVTFDIYGTGPIEDRMRELIDENKLSDTIKLHGNLNYSEFDQTVEKFDLFIGSGTAIIQAASLGVPSIVGIENITTPQTYGYFCDVNQHEYNLKGLDLPLFEIKQLIIDFYKKNHSERVLIKNNHVNSIESFTNESCQNSMQNLEAIKMPTTQFKYNVFRYEFTRILDKMHARVNMNHPARLRFVKPKSN